MQLFPLLLGLVAVALSLLATAALQRKIATSTPIPGLPQAPDVHWFWGHVNLFKVYLDTSLRYLQGLGWAPYVSFFHPLTGPSLLTAHPDFVEKVVKNRQLVNQSWVIRNVFSGFFKKGLICLEGEMWKKHVRVLGPMLSVPRLKAAVPSMLVAAKAVEEKWRAQLREDPSQAVDVAPDLKSLSLAIISEFMLGRTFRDADPAHIVQQCDVMMQSITVFNTLQTKLHRAVFGEPASTRTARAFLRSLVREVMREVELRPESAQGHAIGQIMAAVRDEGVDFSEEEMVDEVVMIVFASHDTTAVSLMWFLKLLAITPDVQSKLRAELNGTLGKGVEPTYDDVTHRLPYLDICFKELMRLAPTASGLSRSLLADVALPGAKHVTVPKGTSISVATAAMHVNPNYWVDPQRLWPERWEEGPGRGQAAGPEGKPIHPGAYAPFGAGQRSCFGIKLGTLELKVLLCQLVRAFEFLPTGDSELDGMAAVPRVTTRPVHSVVKMRALS